MHCVNEGPFVVGRSRTRTVSVFEVVFVYSPVCYSHYFPQGTELAMEAVGPSSVVEERVSIAPTSNNSREVEIARVSLVKAPGVRDSPMTGGIRLRSLHGLGWRGIDRPWTATAKSAAC